MRLLFFSKVRSKSYMVTLENVHRGDKVHDEKQMSHRRILITVPNANEAIGESLTYDIFRVFFINAEWKRDRFFESFGTPGAKGTEPAVLRRFSKNNRVPSERRENCEFDALVRDLRTIRRRVRATRRREPRANAKPARKLFGPFLRGE